MEFFVGFSCLSVGIVIVVSCSKYDEGFISLQCVQYLSSIKLELSNNEFTFFSVL